MQPFLKLFHILTGKFQEELDEAATRFLTVSHTMDGDMATSESVKFDWPRYVSLNFLKQRISSQVKL